MLLFVAERIEARRACDLKDLAATATDFAGMVMGGRVGQILTKGLSLTAAQIRTNSNS